MRVQKPRNWLGLVAVVSNIAKLIQLLIIEILEMLYGQCTTRQRQSALIGEDRFLCWYYLTADSAAAGDSRLRLQRYLCFLQYKSCFSYKKWKNVVRKSFIFNFYVDQKTLETFLFMKFTKLASLTSTTDLKNFNTHFMQTLLVLICSQIYNDCAPHLLVASRFNPLRNDRSRNDRSLYS